MKKQNTPQLHTQKQCPRRWIKYLKNTNTLQQKFTNAKDKKDTTKKRSL